MSDSVRFGTIGDVVAMLAGEAPEAPLKLGQTIVKVDGEHGDSTPVGTTGKVLASHDLRGLPLPPDTHPAEFGYFVEWADASRHPGVRERLEDRAGVSRRDNHRTVDRFADQLAEPLRSAVHAALTLVP